MFYEGLVVDADPPARIAKTKQFLMVTWTDSEQQAQDKAYPAHKEAEMIKEVWHDLRWHERSSAKVITFYKDQCRELNRLLGNNVCTTVDSSQGGEYDVGILSSGRCTATPSSVGFLSDRRRINVAMSRFKDCCVVFANECLGHYPRGAPSQNFWAHMRVLASRCGALLSLGDVARKSMAEISDQVRTRLLEGPIADSHVRHEAKNLMPFFNSICMLSSDHSRVR